MPDTILAPASFSSIQSLSHVLLFVTPCTAARQASLSITTSQSLIKPVSIEWVMPSNHLMLCHPLPLLPSGYFPMCQFFISGGQSIGVSGSSSVLPMNIQYWFPLGLTGLISLQSKGLSRVFSNTTVQKHQFFSSAFFIVQLLHPYMTTGKTIVLTRLYLLFISYFYNSIRIMPLVGRTCIRDILISLFPY